MTDLEYNQLWAELDKLFWEAYGIDYAPGVNTPKKDLDEEPQSPQPPQPPVKRGAEAPAFRQDVLTERMIDLRKKKYTYRQIADKLGCSPSTVRNRLKNKELLSSLWLDSDV